jgi:hypothetical protein
VPISFQNVVDVSITSHDPEAAKLIGVRDWAMGAGMPAEHVFGAADSTRASDKVPPDSMASFRAGSIA